MMEGVYVSHKWESIFYFFVWIGAIVYSTYELSLSSRYFSNYHDLYADFAPGWSLIGKKEDVSEQEWRVWIPMMSELIPWIFFQHLISKIIKTTQSIMLLCCWYISTSASFFYYYIGLSGMLCILVQPSLVYFLTYKRNKFIIWMVHVLLLFVIHILKTPNGLFQSMLGLTDEEHYIVTLSMCWVQLRSISYNIDTIENYSDIASNGVSHFLRNYLWKLGYCLYLPTLSLGPLVLYYDFKNSVCGPRQFWSFKVLTNFGLNLIRYVFWIYFAKFFLHFVYFNAIQYHPEIVQVLSPWALYGLGYCMGQFFLIKYVVVYGLNHNLCAMDDIKAPPQPKCIARIHLYSDMWKYFDRGLYKFLVRYIYKPLLTLNINKYVASFSCFTFVFVWHGMQMNIFIWALLNFIGLTIETLAKSVSRTYQYCEIQNKCISSENARRFKCILTSPLLAMSAVSNFYFFAGYEIGNIYVQRIIHESWSTLCLVLFVLYCCCQVSTDVKNWESQQP